MPCTPWVEISLHPEDYISSSMLPTDIHLQSPDDMTSRDLFTLSAHIHYLQSTYSSSADASGKINFGFRTQDEIRAALQARLTKSQVPVEIEEDDGASSAAACDNVGENG
jgi:hypothetical protein